MKLDYFQFIFTLIAGFFLGVITIYPEQIVHVIIGVLFLGCLIFFVLVWYRNENIKDLKEAHIAECEELRNQIVEQANKIIQLTSDKKFLQKQLKGE